MSKETYNVYAKIKHGDGDIEKRRLWLEGFTRESDAETAAEQAVKYNQGVVMAAWVEPAPQQGGMQ